MQPDIGLSALLLASATAAVQCFFRCCAVYGTSSDQTLNQTCEACRDVLYLDLALDTAVRAAIEPVLTHLHHEKPAQQPSPDASLVLELVLACSDNASLSMSSNAELLMVLKELEVGLTAWHGQ